MDERDVYMELGLRIGRSRPNDTTVLKDRRSRRGENSLPIRYINA